MAPKMYTSAARPSSVPRWPKSTPDPGVIDIPLIMSASCPSPLERKRAMTCCLDIPAGRRFPMTPLNRTSVALPRIFGPNTVNATLPEVIAITKAMRILSGLRRRPRRRTVLPKSLGRSTGMDIPGRPGPPKPRPIPGRCRAAGVLMRLAHRAGT